MLLMKTESAPAAAAGPARKSELDIYSSALLSVRIDTHEKKTPSGFWMYSGDRGKSSVLRTYFE